MVHLALRVASFFLARPLMLQMLKLRLQLHGHGSCGKWVLLGFCDTWMHSIIFF
jgi:hypothetical protein